MDRRFFLSLLAGLFVILAIVAVIVWVAETDRTLGDLGAAFYWSVTTVPTSDHCGNRKLQWQCRWVVNCGLSTPL